MTGQPILVRMAELVIVLPEKEYDKDQIAEKEIKNKAKKGGLDDEKAYSDGWLKKLEDAILTPEEMDAIMYHVQCKFCHTKTRALFGVAIGSKRAWVKAKCPECHKKMEFILFKVKCPKCGHRTKTFRVSITKNQQKVNEKCPECKIEMDFEENPLLKVNLETVVID
jgi:transcription elongation factor Elf1